ncbi:MAG TPA: phosphopantothenoylcysteine decarboxylase [Chthoniobacterales bacterium]|nr:phosphopantothenoylcysteine decarboxylase [Chthoniobacterales bacterium]
MRFLITAGPTREPIDPVRYISNRSSGKMGYAIAEAAIEAGHEVVLISGPVDVDRPRGVAVIPISTSDEMFEAVSRHTSRCDILVMCAAVADYKPAKVAKNKIKKRGENISLELVPTRDILASLPKDRQYLAVGFAAETENVEDNAQKKLREKNCDIVVANDALIGMESEENEVTILFRDGEIKRISRDSKRIISRDLVKVFENYSEKRLTKKKQ